MSARSFAPTRMPWVSMTGTAYSTPATFCTLSMVLSGKPDAGPLIWSADLPVTRLIESSNERRTLLFTMPIEMMAATPRQMPTTVMSVCTFWSQMRLMLM